MLLCLGLGAAGIAAAEVTLEGFPNHWTQDDPTQTSYRAYTPEHCPPGCVAIAGAAIVQYYKVGEGPDQATNTCRVNGESRTLTTESETYNWADPSSDDYGRLAYNLGVRLGMSYETSSSSVAFAKLKDVLDDYGLASTYVSCVSGEPTDDDYARLIQTPLCLGWPVALTIGGDLTSHAVIATGRREDGDTYIFAGYGGRGDGWNTLPDINLTANGGPGTYNRIDGLLIVRPPCEDGKIWAAVTGTVTVKGDLPNVSLTCNGQTIPLAEDGTYALALQVMPGETVTLTCGNRSTLLAFTSPDELPRQVDFDLTQDPPAEGSLSIAPQLLSIDLEQDAVFPLHCYQANGKGGLTEVDATWSFSPSSVSRGADGTLTCSDISAISIPLTVIASYEGKTTSTSLTLYPRMRLKVKSRVPAYSHSGILPSATGEPAAGETVIWPGTRITATNIVLSATTGGQTVDRTDLSEAEFQIGTNLGFPISGTAITAPNYTGALRQLEITLQARRAGDTDFSSDPQGAIVYVGLASTVSQLGAQYGDAYDRVPDSWLEAYFIDLLMQGNSLEDVAAGDYDGDGLLNWEEYVAGTDPRDASSRFRITGLTIENGVPTLTWSPNLPNRRYVLQGKTTLDDDWQNAPGNDARFFRVTVDNPAN